MNPRRNIIDHLVNKTIIRKQTKLNTKRHTSIIREHKEDKTRDHSLGKRNKKSSVEQRDREQRRNFRGVTGIGAVTLKNLRWNRQ